MSGTRKGGLKAAKTNKQRYGGDFYGVIGRMGGAVSRGGGFAKDPELAKKAGSIGGSSRWSNYSHCKRGHKWNEKNIVVGMSPSGPYKRCIQCLKIDHPHSKLLQR